MCLIEFTELNYQTMDLLLGHPTLNCPSSFVLILGSSLLVLGRVPSPSQMSPLVSFALASLLNC